MLREILSVVVLCGDVDATRPPSRPALDEARRLWQNGRYAEAPGGVRRPRSRSPAKLARPPASRLALGRADCLASQGEYDKAVEAARDRSRPSPSQRRPRSPGSPSCSSAAATGTAPSAPRPTRLKADPDHLAARWVAARLLEARGELDKAVEAWKWFIDRYNARQPRSPRDADALLIVGQAAERYYRAKARGEELSESLNDVINEIYEGALKADPHCWQAPWLEGRLFLSGYNESRRCPRS